MEWIHKEIIIGETACHECCCSNCGYAVMRYSHLIYDLRAGRPYVGPEYNYCPNCGERVEKHEKQSEVL
jgi:hypothetical protein